MSSLTTRYPGERLFTFALMLFSIFLFWRAYLISGFSELSSPGAIPMGASAVMVFATSIAFAQSFKQPLAEGVRFFHHGFPIVVGAMMAFIVLYAVMLEQLGFLSTSLLFLVISLRTLSQFSMLSILGLSTLCLMAIYIVFRLIFQIVLPEGILPEREILAAIEHAWEAL